MLVSIFTGFIAGALHVIGGVDHLVAIAPTAISKPQSALRTGLLWGLGHSTGVIILSVSAIFIKDFIPIQRMSFWAELGVGIFLLVLGLLAIRTALGLDIHSHYHKHGQKNIHHHFHFHLRGNRKHDRHSHALTSLGILHGIAGGGHLLAVLPALALPFFAAISYMFSYLLGSLFAMGLAVFVMSIASVSSGEKAFPLLIGATGVTSILTGLFWIQKTSSLIFLR